MIDEALKEKIIERAQENFLSGLNCAESVYEAFVYNKAIDMPYETLALASGFGGGCGMTGNQCGALNAAVMAVGSVHGRRDPYATEEALRKEILHTVKMRAFNNLINHFKERNGTVLCREVCENNGGYVAPERKEYCCGIVEDMITEAVKYINMSEAEVKELPYGPNMGNYK